MDSCIITARFYHHFTGPADLSLPAIPTRQGLDDGVLYYLSHPPLAYDLPHLLFTLTGAEPNVLGLQVFNLFFHLLNSDRAY